MSELDQLKKRREEIGRDLDKHYTLRRQAQARLKAAEEERDKKKKELKKKRRRDPVTEERIEQLEREIKNLAERIKEFNEDVIPRLEKAEREETKRIDELHERGETVAEKIEREKKEQEQQQQIVVQSGAPHWGGAEDIIVREVNPVMASVGLYRNSGKRAANDPLTIANPGSDHSVLAINASAGDYGTFDGEGPARKVAQALGITNWSPGNYNGYYIKRAGRTYRVQILWAVSGHFNHVHVGIRLV